MNFPIKVEKAIAVVNIWKKWISQFSSHFSCFPQAPRLCFKVRISFKISGSILVPEFDLLKLKLEFFLQTLKITKSFFPPTMRTMPRLKMLKKVKNIQLAIWMNPSWSLCFERFWNWNLEKCHLCVISTEIDKMPLCFCPIEPLILIHSPIK